MKKTVNIPKHIHQALKVYATKQDENIEHCTARIIEQFLIHSGTLPSKEVK